MSEGPGPGDSAPPFSLRSTVGVVTLEQLLSDRARLVLAFYVEDGTPSCENELLMLRDAYDAISAAHAGVLAVSADDVSSHEIVAARAGGFPFPLASDPSLECARAYGVVSADDPRRSDRAIFIIDRDRNVLFAIPHFQPANVSQIEAIFQTLGIAV